MSLTAMNLYCCEPNGYIVYCCEHNGYVWCSPFWQPGATTKNV